MKAKPCSILCGLMAIGLISAARWAGVGFLIGVGFWGVHWLFNNFF